MKPYFERDGISLFCGDMLESMPPVMASVFITDPPYSRAGAAHTGRKSLHGAAADAAGSDQFWLYWFREVARRLAHHTAPTGCGFVFCDYRTVHLIERAFSLSDSGWAVTQCLVWDRESTGMGSPFRGSHELIAFCRGPKFTWTGSRSITNVLRFRWTYGEHEHHPAEKPVALLRFLIEATTARGDIVLDPFAGSGSTAVAAQESGRGAVCIEAEEHHLETAARRLDQMVLQEFSA